MKTFNHSFQRSASLSNKTQATLGTLQRMLYVFLWPVCYYKSLLMLAVVCSESEYTSVVSSTGTYLLRRILDGLIIQLHHVWTPVVSPHV